MNAQLPSQSGKFSGVSVETVAAALQRNRELGIALIAVLWMLMLLSLVAAVLALELHSDSRIAVNMAENAAARASADAGIHRAILDLQTPESTENWRVRTDGTLYTWHFDSSVVRISIRDEGSKVDLNQASEAILTALFQLARVSQDKAQALGAAVADFRDPDDLPLVNGAESEAYRHAGLSWGPKNAPFQSAEELQQVLGITPEIYRQVAGQITVYSVTPIFIDATPHELARFLLEAKMNPRLSSTPVYSIRSELRRPSGAAFIREIVLQPSHEFWTSILSWHQANLTEP